MRYKEFKEKVEAWGRKYDYEIEVEINDFTIYVGAKFFGRIKSLATISKLNIFVLETNWDCFTTIETHARAELFDILVEFAKTPPSERKDEKRFIIPLPGLVTTDGEQQYLTQNGSFFASRRDKRLRQTWKKEHLKFVPETKIAVPMKVIKKIYTEKHIGGRKIYIAKCPNCNSHLEYNSLSNYCSNCGQMLDWEDDEEKEY